MECSGSNPWIVLVQPLTWACEYITSASLLCRTNIVSDIVDTEPAEGGNVWKMLLGAINPRFDAD